MVVFFAFLKFAFMLSKQSKASRMGVSLNVKEIISLLERGKIKPAGKILEILGIILSASLPLVISLLNSHASRQKRHLIMD